MPRQRQGRLAPAGGWERRQGPSETWSTAGCVQRWRCRQVTSLRPSRSRDRQQVDSGSTETSSGAGQEARRTVESQGGAAGPRKVRRTQGQPGLAIPGLSDFAI